MEYCAIFWMGGARHGRWRSALPVASAEVASAQVARGSRSWVSTPGTETVPPQD